MTRALTIAAREIRERMFVFFAAAIMATIPFLIAIAPQARTAGRNTVIATGGMIVSLGFTLALALVLGGSFVGRELSERRLSFYFSKPVSAAAIWWGKVSAAVVILAVCFAITFLPSFLVAPGEWRPLWSDSAGGFVEAVLIASIVLLLLLHAGSTMVRSHSPRVVIDLVLLIVVSGAVWLMLSPLQSAFAFDMAARVGRLVAGGFFLALLFSGGWQLSRGRTDIRRSHAELSKFLWTFAAAVVVLVALYVAWVISPSPRDVELESVLQSPRGDWIAIGGRARHRADYNSSFLLNPGTGAATRSGNSRWGVVVFTRRGDAAVTITPQRATGKKELRVLRLDQPGTASDTGIETQSFWPSLALSEDLRRLAIIDQGTLAIHDLTTKALLGSVRLPPANGWFAMFFFASPDVVRLYEFDRPGPTVKSLFVCAYEFDVRRRRFQQTGAVQVLAPTISPVDVSADGKTLLLNTGRGLIIADPRTLEQRVAIAADRPRAGILLRDGGVASFDGSSIHIFGANGAHVRDIPLNGARWVRMRELLPGKKLLAIVLRGPEKYPSGRGFDLLVVDTERGVVERREPDADIRSQYHALADPRQPDIQPREYAIIDANNHLWRWNPLTGAKTRVL